MATIMMSITNITAKLPRGFELSRVALAMLATDTSSASFPSYSRSESSLLHQTAPPSLPPPRPPPPVLI